MTLPQFWLFALTMVLIALGLLPLGEATLQLKGASLLIAIAGVFTVLGGAFAVIGAIRNNTEQTYMILGDENTFCQLIVYAGPGVGWFLSTFHAGPGGAIYDVQVLFHEIREDGTPVYNLQRAVLGTLTSNTWPWPLQMFGIPHQRDLQPGQAIDTTPRYFEAQVTQRNGTSTQELGVYPRVDGTVEVGFLRLEFNGKAREPRFNLLPPGATGIVIAPEEIARIARLRQARRGGQR